VFPSSVRIAVALVLFILGTMLLSAGRLEGLLMIVGALYWLFTYLRYGPVKIAFVAYRKGQIEHASALVDGVRWPRLLAPRYRSYYHWVRGAAAAHAGDLDQAYEEYSRAFAGKLRDPGDRSFLAALMAEIDVMRGRAGRALERVREARGLAHRAELDAILDDLEARAHRGPA
jgi:hypothetical protein